MIGRAVESLPLAMVNPGCPIVQRRLKSSLRLDGEVQATSLQYPGIRINLLLPQTHTHTVTPHLVPRGHLRPASRTEMAGAHIILTLI